VHTAVSIELELFDRGVWQESMEVPKPVESVKLHEWPDFQRKVQCRRKCESTHLTQTCPVSIKRKSYSCLLLLMM